MAIAADSPPTSFDLRSAEILSGIRRAFAEKGFDGASMQDLARAAGMSVGNFYRYFPSKAAIVEAFVTHDLIEVESEFAAVEQASDPMGRLRAALRAKVEEGICTCDDGRMWAEIQAAAHRKPEIRAISDRMEALIVDHLCRAFALATGLVADEAARRYADHARLIVMLVKAAGMHHPDPSERGAMLTALIVRTIDRTLDEIASDAAKG